MNRIENPPRPGPGHDPEATQAPEMRLGRSESVDGAYELELDSRVCQGQVESFYVLAYDLDSGILRGIHGDLAIGPSSLSVHARAGWDDVPVIIFVDIEPIEPGCSVEEQIGQVSGQVLDSAAGPPVPFALVGLVDQGPMTLDATESMTHARAAIRSRSSPRTVRPASPGGSGNRTAMARPTSWRSAWKRRRIPTST